MTSTGAFAKANTRHLSGPNPLDATIFTFSNPCVSSCSRRYQIAAALTPEQIAALTPEEATAKRRELHAALLAKQEDLLSSPKREREQVMLECDAIERQLSALQPLDAAALLAQAEEVFGLLARLSAHPTMVEREDLIMAQGGGTPA